MSEFDFDVVTGPAIPAKGLAKPAPNMEVPQRLLRDPAAGKHSTDVLSSSRPVRAVRSS
jgi:hypothetical protein